MSFIPPHQKLFSLVSNMQIPCLSLRIYNSYNWEYSSTLIAPHAKIYSRDLTCSSFVRLSFCRFPTYCSFGALDGFTLGAYDGTDLSSPEGSNEVTIGGNLEGLLLCDWLESLDVIELGTDVSNKLGFSDGKVIVTTLLALYGISRGT